MCTQACPDSHIICVGVNLLIKGWNSQVCYFIIMQLRELTTVEWMKTPVKDCRVADITREKNKHASVFHGQTGLNWRQFTTCTSILLPFNLFFTLFPPISWPNTFLTLSFSAKQCECPSGTRRPLPANAYLPYDGKMDWTLDWFRDFPCSDTTNLAIGQNTSTYICTCRYY